MRSLGFFAISILLWFQAWVDGRNSLTTSAIFENPDPDSRAGVSRFRFGETRQRFSVRSVRTEQCSWRRKKLRKPRRGRMGGRRGDQPWGAGLFCCRVVSLMYRKKSSKFFRRIIIASESFLSSLARSLSGSRPQSHPNRFGRPLAPLVRPDLPGSRELFQQAS